MATMYGWGKLKEVYPKKTEISESDEGKGPCQNSLEPRFIWFVWKAVHGGCSCLLPTQDNVATAALESLLVKCQKNLKKRKETTQPKE